MDSSARIRLYVQCNQKKFLAVCRNKIWIGKLKQKLQKLYFSCFKQHLEIQAIYSDEFLIPDQYFINEVLENNQKIFANAKIQKTKTQQNQKQILNDQIRLNKEKTVQSQKVQIFQIKPDKKGIESFQSVPEDKKKKIELPRKRIVAPIKQNQKESKALDVSTHNPPQKKNLQKKQFQVKKKFKQEKKVQNSDSDASLFDDPNFKRNLSKANLFK